MHMRMLAIATLVVPVWAGTSFAQTPPAPKAPAGVQAPAQAQAPAPASAQAPMQAKAPEPVKLPASPRGTAAVQVGGSWGPAAQGTGQQYTGGKWIVVDYGRPNLRGRQNIFGSGAEYGKQVSAGAPIWRAGANQTTTLTTEAALTFGDKTIQPGTYSVFVDLKEGAWTLVLSTQPRQAQFDPNNKTATLGAVNYDPQFDVARVPMKLMTSSVSVEQFSIGFVNMTATGGELAMWWEKAFAVVPFTLAK